MPFPELTSRLRKLLPNFNPAPISLNLKTATYDQTQAQWYAWNGYYGIASKIASWAPAWSGEIVNRQTALSLPAVQGCILAIAGTVSQLPVSLMRQTGEDKQDATGHPMYSAMKTMPNDEITSQELRFSMTTQCMLNGGGYAQVIRRSGTGTAIGLYLLTPEQITIDREKTGQKRLVYLVKQPDGASPKTIYVTPGQPQELFHLRGPGWDGKSGFDVLETAKQSIGNAIAAERHVGSFWGNGGRIPYGVELPAKFPNAQAFDQYRSDLETMASNSNKPFIFENGGKYTKIGLNMVESQALESRKFAVAEVSRIWGISPHMLGDLENSNFSITEQMFLQFVKQTLTRWLVCWEQHFSRCVLTEAERAQGYFLRFNLDALLRGDAKTRAEVFSSYLQNGILSINEARDLEDRNRVDGGDAHHIQLNMQTVQGTGDPTIVEQGILNGGNSADSAKSVALKLISLDKAS